MLIGQSMFIDISFSVFEGANEKYRGINTTFINEDFRDISRSFEQIKMDLVKKFKDLPNPATYLVVSKLKLPLSETSITHRKEAVSKNDYGCFLERIVFFQIKTF